MSIDNTSVSATMWKNIYGAKQEPVPANTGRHTDLFQVTTINSPNLNRMVKTGTRPPKAILPVGIPGHILEVPRTC